MRSIKSNPWIDNRFERHVQNNEELQKDINWRGKFNENYTENLNDLFSGFYRDFSWTDKPNPLMKHLVSQAETTEDFRELRRKTRNNDFLSGLAMREFKEKLDDALAEDYQKKNKEKLDKDPNDQEAKKELNEWLKGKGKDGVKEMIRGIVEEMSEDIEKADGLARCLGYGDDPCQPQQIDTELVMALYQKLKGSNKLESIVKMIGRMKNLALSTIETKSVHAEDEIVGIEQGDEIAKILPEEFAVKELFMLNFAESACMQYTFEGKDPLDDGPIILWKDESGSMWGEMNDTASAICFGMWQVAKRTNRPFYVIRFSTEIQCHEIKKDVDLVPLISSFMGGGTEFNQPMIETIRIMNEYREFKKADMIVVTDGEAGLKPEILEQFMKFKEIMSFKTLAIKLDYSEPYVLREFCDKIFSGNLNQEGFLNEIFSV